MSSVWLKRLARGIFRQAQAVTRGSRQVPQVILAIAPADHAHLPEIRRRFEFFFPSVSWDGVTHADALTWLNAKPDTTILKFGNLGTPAMLERLHGGVYDIDWRTNPQDGWNWIDAASRVAGHTVDFGAAKDRYEASRQDLSARGANAVYVFGTGPSLEKASGRTWNDGVRIVCNTIVRDHALWHHIDPDLIVAGDGIYHFGFTDFATEFRADLVRRLEESGRTLFLYPAQFDIIVRRSLPAWLHARLIPVPVGKGTDIHQTLRRFELPGLGNVLNLLLLPVACDLGRRVQLWGFDGRAPTDQLFWANSVKQSYAELLPTLQAAHPAFFDHHVPKEDPEKYLRSVHGDVLENCFQQAEREGWHFDMLHHSWTQSLSRRQEKAS